MKLDELIQRVGVDNVGVQVLHDSITGAKQRRGYVDVSFGTDCVSMHDIATGGAPENVSAAASLKAASRSR